MYNLAHRILKKLDPELSHNISIKALKLGIYPKIICKNTEILEQTIWGRTFKTPIGLSAGFDKNAEVINPILNLGFSVYTKGMNYEFLPILAIFGGIIFSLMFKTKNEFITKKYSTIILQTGIVLLGLSINYQSAINSSLQYMPAISIFVVLTFTFVFLLGLSLKIDKNYSILVASGSSICGGTAMAAVAPVIKSKPQELSIAIAIIFLLNAIGILFFPLIAEQINLSQSEFGLWAATAIHDTSAVIGAAMIYGAESLEVAATLKLGRTLWIIPLIIILSLINRTDSRPKLPLFVIGFILAIFIGSSFQLPIDSSQFKQLSSVFLLLGLFCVGTQISKNAFVGVDKSLFIFPVLIWLIVIPASLFLTFQIA